MPKKKRTTKRRTTKRPAPPSRPTPYDDTNAKKGGIAVWVEYHDAEGRSKKLLYGPEHGAVRWTWKRIAGQTMLQVDCEGTVLTQIPQCNVVAVGGQQFLFRDAEWK